jgi:subtilisin family serine protease
MKTYLIAAVAGAALLSACDSPSGSDKRLDGKPDAVSLQSGSAQQGPAGETLAQPIVLRVTDHKGQPAAGAVVTFSTRDTTHGVVTPAQATSGADGLVQATWRLGRVAGVDSVTATAELTGAPIVVTATATPNGVISGTVTAEGSAAAAWSAARAGSAAADLAAMPLQTIGGQPIPAQAQTALVVTFRPQAVGAPRVGSAALRSRTTAAAVGRGMRERLGAHRGLSFRVQDVSPAVLAARIRVDAGRADEVRAALLRDAAVARVEPDGYARGAAMVTPDEALWAAQQWHYEMIDMPRAWGITTGSNSVLVAVVDDGIRFEHPDIGANLTSDGYDFVSSSLVSVCGGGTVNLSGDGDGYDPDPTIPAIYSSNGACYASGGLGGHGLHVAGTVGAVGNNSMGVAGVAWNVRIRPVRVLNGGNFGSYFDIAQGLLYAAGLPASDGFGGTVQAATGARIINMSLGGAGESTVLRDAVLAAHGAGALIVASAMNEASTVPYYPAAYPEVISVSAVGPRGTLSSFSSYGPTVDIAAPGGDRAQGGNNSSFMVGSLSWNFTSGQQAYVYNQGTSMAAPHVSGVAALLLAREPGLTAAQLRARLLDYAVDAGPPGHDDQYGAGILNARNSLMQNSAPARSLLVRLYDAQTGAFVREVKPTGGAFSFGGLANGSYWVMAGEDEEGDGATGLPGRRWGALGGVGTPAAVQVEGAYTYPVSFAIGHPHETEPNAAMTEANRLVLGGWYDAELTSGDVDWYRVTLPAGTYTFDTQGRGGGCRYALGADTQLSLYDAGGVLLASAEDPDAPRFRHCARLDHTVAAGTYLVAVRTPGNYPGAYALTVRPGS